MKFEGTKDYIATEDLRIAVNASISLERPLLVKGEPGTGKTVLAEEIAKALDMPILTWHIKSTTKAQQGLYEYDAITRLRDSQLGDERVKDVKNYIKKGKLWDAFDSNKRPILLIDEIHTPDSSRYWIADTYEERMANGFEPQNIDKEFLRLWFVDNCDPYNDETLPEAPDELVSELSSRYIYLYEKITGETFPFPNSNELINDRINKKLKDI